MTNDNTRYSLRITKELFEKIKKDAKALNISIASMMRIILSQYYK